MIEMHTEKSKIMFSDYCRLDEINYCRLKLKAQLFSTFCKLAREGERYVFTYWYSAIPLGQNAKSIQLSINAVIKDRQADTEDIIRKVIPNVGQKTLFSTLSSILKFGKNHSKSKKIIGDKKMVTKCPKCGAIVPVAANAETTLLKEEIKNKDLIIENLRKDNEELMATIAKLQEQKPVEVFEEETVEETPITEEVKEVEEEKIEIPAEDIVAAEQVAVEEIPAETEIVESVEIVGDSPIVEELIEEAKTNDEVVEELPEEIIETPAIEEVVEEPTVEENTVEEVAVEEKEAESEIIPSEELPEQVDEPVEETVQPEQEAVIEEPVVEEVVEEENIAVEETAEEQPQEEVKEEKVEDPYQIYVTPVVKI